MARKKREKSATGVYHVMLRGINRQNVFLDRDDMLCMLRCMVDVQSIKAPDGTVISKDNCTYYAYCILHNHMHLLVREGNLDVSEIMKRLQDKYVVIYNRKYDRVGHLFQDRFASEPVDSIDYFHTLLRYIHRNPVKAMEATAPENYEFSSWREYLLQQVIMGSDPLMTYELPLRTTICELDSSLRRFGYTELVEWVNVAGADDRCMDMDTGRIILSDVEAAEVILEICRLENVEYFRQQSAEYQVECIRHALTHGVTMRQASRISSLSYRTLWNRLNPKSYQERLERERNARRMSSGNKSSEGLTP